MKNLAGKFINTPLYIEQLKRFWAIPTLALVGYVLFVVVMTYTSGTNWAQRPNSMVMILTGNHPFLIIASVAFPLFAAAALFPQHFNSVTATAFAGFPVNKRQLIFTNFAAGLTMLVVPLVLLSLMLLVPVRLPGFYVPGEGWQWQFWARHWSVHIWGSLGYDFLPQQVINTPLVVLGFLGRTVLTFVFYFAMGIMAVSVSGNRVVSALLVGAAAALPAAVLALSWIVANAYVFGFYTQGDFFINQVMLHMHPVMLGSIISNNWWFVAYATDTMWHFYLSYALIALGMLGVGTFACLRRRAERAGESVAFTPLKNLLVFLLSVAGMVAGGVWFMAVFESRAGFYFGFIIGFVLVYFLAQMIAEKSLQVGHKIKRLPHFAGSAAVLYIAMLLFTRGGLHGYVTHVPPADNIAGAFVFHGMPRQHWREGEQFAFIRDREIIEQITQAHRAIIGERRNLREYVWSDFTGAWRRVALEHIPIMYLLHDGTTVTRTYRVPQDLMAELGWEALLATEEVILSNQPALDDPRDVIGITLSLPPVITSRAHLEEIAEELRAGIASPHHNFAPGDLEWLEELLTNEDEEYIFRWLRANDPSLLSRTILVTDRAQIQSLVAAMRTDYIATRRAERIWWVHARPRPGEIGIVDTRGRYTNVSVELHIGRTTEEHGLHWWNSRFINLFEYANTRHWVQTTEIIPPDENHMLWHVYEGRHGGRGIRAVERMW